MLAAGGKWKDSCDYFCACSYLLNAELMAFFF